MRLDGDIRAQDAALKRHGLTIWIGAEPTFTRRESFDPWWLFDAEGGDKEERAQALLAALAPRLHPKARVSRLVGRQYPGEARPRFALGASWPDEDGDACLTVTPDPAVVEVNMAPAQDLAAFAAQARAVYAAASDAGLSPVRYRYNGQAGDSGGGGQITFGGRTPETSPFFRHPQVLPGLLRTLNRHPSLSYAFAPECVGSASQGPRPDEGVRERFDELPVALDRLAARGDLVTPEELGACLGPLLADCSGNSHRAEVNVEKLWNPSFAVRGCLGLVELRALRMPPTPERLVAVAALFRALCAGLAVAPSREPLIDWGAKLHDRFALPFALEDDLAAVLDELGERGVPLGPELARHVLAPRPPLCRVALGGATLTLTQALEFWPLVGDVASQERRGARVVDSSTERIEVRTDAPGRVVCAGVEVPLTPIRAGREHVAGVRYRAFVPRPGFHEGLAPHDPLEFVWVVGAEALSIALYGWDPSGRPYDGLPGDDAEAEARRAARVVVSRSEVPPPGRRVVANGLSVDLRR